MRDPVISLLVVFEKRFTKLGHDPRVALLQPEVPGESRLKCVSCGETATIEIRDNGWRLLTTSLDVKCLGDGR